MDINNVFMHVQKKKMKQKFQVKEEKAQWESLILKESQDNDHQDWRPNWGPNLLMSEDEDLVNDSGWRRHDREEDQDENDP